jgi:hypothetical protein
MARPAPARESSLVRAIVKALRQIPGLVVRKRWGTALGTAGDPDLYGVVAGRHFELEVKRPGNIPTPLQTARLKEWRCAGAIAGVVHNAHEALELLRPIMPTQRPDS